MGCLSSKTVQHVVIVENMEPSSPIEGFGKAGGTETPTYKFEVEKKTREIKMIGTKNNKILSQDNTANFPERVTPKEEEDFRTVKVQIMEGSTPTKDNASMHGTFAEGKTLSVLEETDENMMDCI